MVEGRRYHPSVIAETLPGFLSEVIHAARAEDWQAVADELITEARKLDGAGTGEVGQRADSEA